MYKRFFSVLGVTSLVLAGCNEDPVGPESVPCDAFLLSYGQTVGDTVTTPDGVRYMEVATGAGAEPVTSSNVATVNFSGYQLSNSELFQTTCAPSSGTLTFHVGTGQVQYSNFLIIEGFQIGILGMREGGVRRVIIPPDLAFGTIEQNPGHELAGEDVIFDLHLVDVE